MEFGWHEAEVLDFHALLHYEVLSRIYRRLLKSPSFPVVNIGVNKSESLNYDNSITIIWCQSITGWTGTDKVPQTSLFVLLRITLMHMFYTNVSHMDISGIWFKPENIFIQKNRIHVYSWNASSSKEICVVCHLLAATCIILDQRDSTHWNVLLLLWIEVLFALQIMERRHQH